MKKKKILPFVILSLTACNNSNDDQSEVSLVGKWKLDKVQVYTSKNKQTVTHVASGCEKESIHEFRETDMISTTFAPENGVCVKTDVVIRKYTYDPIVRKFWYEKEKDYPYIVSKLNHLEMNFEDHLQDFDEDGINDIAKYFFTKSN